MTRRTYCLSFFESMTPNFLATLLFFLFIRGAANRTQTNASGFFALRIDLTLLLSALLLAVTSFLLYSFSLHDNGHFVFPSLQNHVYIGSLRKRENGDHVLMIKD